MKRNFLAVVTAVAMVAASAGVAAAQDLRMRIHNDTGLTLSKFYSPTPGPNAGAAM